jgi:hypothetical protein
LFQNLTDKEFLRYGRSWRDRLPGYYHLMANPKILDVVEALIGGEIFANPVYNVRPKVPKVAAGAVPWHQDKSYWPDANSNPVITVWIPLVDATLENGCLHIIPRTHKKRVLSYHKETYTGTGYTELDEKHVKTPHVVALPLEAGGAILFNDRCIQARALERRPAVSTDRPGPHATAWCRVPGTQPPSSQPRSDPGGLVSGASRAPCERVTKPDVVKAKQVRP